MIEETNDEKKSFKAFADQMTPEEIKEELESMVKDHLGLQK
ncbi:hypothetical protein [Bacillus paramycoides]|nr:hypothetical protein [Bacillus paramycoides]